MNIQDYVQASGRTVSSQFHAELVHGVDIIDAITEMDEIGNYLDLIKKALFYGKAISDDIEGDADIFSDVPNELHSVLGMLTEVLEIAQVLLYTGETINDSKVTDEVGDLFWYIALLLRTRGIDVEDVLERNIAKLKIRYPDKFVSELAVNRNDALEQKVFETA